VPLVPAVADAVPPAVEVDAVDRSVVVVEADPDVLPGVGAPIAVTRARFST